MTPGLKKFIHNWLINTLSVLVAVYIVPGIHYGNPLDLVAASLVLGILNSILRPFMLFLALPLLLFTLGLFLLIINAAVLFLVGLLLGPHFHVDSFGAAFWGALIISLVSMILNSIAGTGNTRVQVQRRKPPSPPGPGSSDGGGPVIDI
jgi:putative membrane protein